MSKKIVIGCRLPHGIVLEHAGRSVELNGRNKHVFGGLYVPEYDYGTTEVDADFWEAWIKEHPTFPAVLSNAIFVAKTEADLKAIGNELKQEKTGMEQLDPEKETEVKPLDKK